ncbi:beta-glucosidase btgE [Penicillium angulare]|uniref:Probable beta-glucosidase btgE n=1 Tax=Penicillium angulare TaxID=116970 RepID=A0A9W9FCW3_9EURO|nr:beta-glucosidase btgE [Penicillium angulare]
MKGSVIAAAAFAGSVLAEGNLHRRHEAIHQKRAVAASGSASASASASPTSSVPLSPPDETCGCTTKVITLWGSPTLVPIPQTSTTEESTSTLTSTTEESTSTLTSTVHSTSTKTATVTVTPSVAPVSSAAPSTSTVYVSLPTNGVTSYSSTGTYTVPATTMTVTDTTTVCGATTTAATSGTHTIGGVTTVVSTETTVTCPYATVKPSGTTVTSVIEYTTYTCPAAGTYTVVPGTTTVVPSDTTIVYPTPSTIAPGTYTKPETTLTVTETDTTYYCPFSSSTGLASTSAAAPTTVAPAPATTTAAAAPTTVVASSTSSAAQASSTSSSGLTGAGKYGMTFSPYTDSGNCMSQSEVTKNIKIISEKGFDLVRVYSTDCNSLEYIGNACKEMGMSMILGVYIESTGTSGAQEQVDAINKWAQWDMVKLIVVGNEAVSSGYVSASQLASFISSSKSSFKSAGYTGQVTTTEPIDIWQQYGTSNLCSPVDIVGANIHPFFNADTTAEQAGEFALSEYKILEKICNLDVLNLETGWPNAGDANGAAVPGVSEQETAIKGIAEAIGSKSIFFSYADDAWKAPGEFQVENHWGCKSVF